MSLRKGSRYEGLKVFLYKDEYGRKRTVLDVRPPVDLKAIGSKCKIHIKKSDHGDYLDILAIKNGATREELWYLIADINNVEKPLDIPGNTVLYIPPISEFLKF